MVPNSLFAPVIGLYTISRHEAIVHDGPRIANHKMNFGAMVRATRGTNCGKRLPHSSSLCANEFSIPLSRTIGTLCLVNGSKLGIDVSSIERINAAGGGLIVIGTPSPRRDHQRVLPERSTRLITSLPPFHCSRQAEGAFIGIGLPKGAKRFSTIVKHCFAIFT